MKILRNILTIAALILAILITGCSFPIPETTFVTVVYITDNTGYHSIIPIQIAHDKWPSAAIIEFSTLSGY